MPSSAVYAANFSNYVKGSLPVFEQTAFESTTNSAAADLLVAQSASTKVECPRKSIAEVDSNMAVRIFCYQGRLNKKEKYEVTHFSPAFESGDILKLNQRKLIKQNWFYKKGYKTVENRITRIFPELSAASFNGKQKKLGWSGSYIYVLFTFKKQSCFGFRKNRTEKILHGYYCGTKKDVYTPNQIKSMLKKIDLR